jgi:hypothetical protein
LGKEVLMLQILSPIANFINNTGKPVHIDNDFIIRPAKSPEVNYLKGLYEGDRLLGDFEGDYRGKMHVIESYVDPTVLPAYVPFNEFRGSEREYTEWLLRYEEVLQQCRRTIENRLTFLRLMKPGQITCKVFVVYEPTKEGRAKRAYWVRYYVPWHYENYPNKYEISNNDIAEFVDKFELFGLKISIDEYPSLRYFSKGYHEPLLEDRILDIVIALESLYLPEDEDKSSLRYKLGMRCAAYISEEGVTRKDVFERVKDAYKIRSTIVHGRRKSKKEEASKKVKEIFPHLENYLRISLIKALSHSKWPRAEDFDRILLKEIS